MHALTYRKPAHGCDMVSIAEDSHGHLEVTREQHLRMIRKVASGQTRRRSCEGSDMAMDGHSRSNISRNIGNRARTHSSDTPPSNLKSRLANLSKLIRVKSNVASSSKHEQHDQDRSYDANARTPPNGGRQRCRSVDVSSVSSSQVAGDNGSVNSSVAVESVANLTEASLDTVKVSNITEKQSPSSVSSSSGIKNKSVVKQWNKFKRLVGVKTAPEESLTTASTLNKNDFPYSNRYDFPRDRANTDDTRSSNTQSKASPWRRVRSDGSSSANSSHLTGRSNPPLEYYNSKTKSMMDDRIRGRLDGVEMLSLGSSQLIQSSRISPKESKQRGANTDDDVLLPTLTYTFAGKPLKTTNSELVSHMLWSSGGSYPPEIILDGICPGPDGRWTVRLEDQYLGNVMQNSSVECSRIDMISPSSAVSSRNASRDALHSWKIDRSSPIASPRPNSPELPGLQPSSSDECDPASDSSIPVHVLQKKLWGPDIGPADLTNFDEEEELALLRKGGRHDTDNRDDSFSGSVNTDDPLLSLAARCSIPIDVDEDIFIISTRDHVNSIHEIASASIAKGRFAVALRVFETLLKGLNTLKYTDSSNQTDKEESDLRFSKGATMHNIGILQLWLGQYQAALKSFENAAIERRNLLPKNHPDTCVSLIRQATACFAIGRMEDSKAIFEQVLTMLPSGHVARAKVLNNLAVVCFRQGNSNAALKEFTKSLEIQRVWLDAPVRRPCTVYDAALTLKNIGELYLDRQDFDLALYLYEEALMFQTSIFRKEHPSVLETLSSLAIAKVRNGEIENGIQILQGCLRSQTAKYGKNDSHVIETIGLLGLLHTSVHSYDDSLQCFVQVRKWQKLNLQASSHPALRESKDLIKVVESAVFARGSGSSNINGQNHNNSNSSSGGTTGHFPKVWV